MQEPRVIVLKGMSFLTAAENRESFFKRIALFLPEQDPRYKEILKAYNDAKDAFRKKYRDDGITRYFEHLRAVSLILIDYLRVRDYKIIIAALLHDIVEDCPEWTLKRVEEEYGQEVALLLAFLTKPPEANFATKEQRDDMYHMRFRQAPRNFFLIKLSDRLHNLLTLYSCSNQKRLRKIEETRLHYLPYAEEHLILLHELEEAIEQLTTG